MLVYSSCRYTLLTICNLFLQFSSSSSSLPSADTPALHFLIIYNAPSQQNPT